MTNRPTQECHSSSLCTRHCRAQRGFSLLEVLVAFAILALSLGLLIQIFAQALNTTALSGEYSRATTLAETHLNAVGIDIPLEPGNYDGEPENGLSWQVFIEPFEPDNDAWEPVLEAFLVTSVVSWDTGGDKRRRISLSSLRLGSPLHTAGLDSDEIPALPTTPQGNLGR